MKIVYVLGFLCDLSTGEVLLIEKKRGPQYVVGRWNGLGGKVNEGEELQDAMSRKFLEEAGVVTSSREWEPRGLLQVCQESDGKPICDIHVFRCVSSEIMNTVKTTLRERGNPADETIRPIPLAAMPSNVVPNVPWLLAASLDQTLCSFRANYV